LFCNFIDCNASVLKNQFLSCFFILCSCGCGLTIWMNCIIHIRMAIFEHFNLLMHNCIRESMSRHWVHMRWWIRSLVHLLHTKRKHSTDHCPSLVQFSSYAAMFTTS
jgi:hypothetical protein